MNEPKSQKVEAWVVCKARANGYGVYQTGPYRGEARVGTITVSKTTQTKPATADNEIAFKIELDVHESWFLNGTATIKVALPERAADEQEMTAVVEMPVKGRGKSAAAAVIKP